MTFRPFRLVAAGAASAVIAVLAAPVACVDTSPLDYHPPTYDAGVPDDGGADSGVVRQCRECLSAENGPCTADYDACAKDARCGPAVECILALKCFAFAQIQDKLSCGAPCIAKYDLNSATDPAVMLLIPINTCTAGPCFDACVTR